MQRLTGFIPVTACELKVQIQNDIAKGNRKAGEAVICPVCQCELFEGLDFDADDIKPI